MSRAVQFVFSLEKSVGGNEKALYIRIDKRAHQRMQAIKEIYGISMNQFISQAIYRLIAQLGKLEEKDYQDLYLDHRSNPNYS